jgi:hypothetical protein
VAFSTATVINLVSLYVTNPRRSIKGCEQRWPTACATSCSWTEIRYWGVTSRTKLRLPCSQVQWSWWNKTTIQPASIDVEGLKRNEFRYNDTSRVAVKQSNIWTVVSHVKHTVFKEVNIGGPTLQLPAIPALTVSVACWVDITLRALFSLVEISISTSQLRQNKE